jgi:D-lactate dehydrogenase (cytochrome)
LIHRISARRARDEPAPHIERDAAVVASFLSDAAHVAGGFAAGVAFPRTEAEVAALVRDAARVLPIGAQSSLTGGATPRGELVLSTRALLSIEVGPVLVDGPAPSDTVRVGAGVPLTTLLASLKTSRLYYPPVPTYDGAFVGGTISTNAAGAATFKYGSTRPWVSAITVVLANGDVLDLQRGAVMSSVDGRFEVTLSSGQVVSVPVPTYRMPHVAKLSAGYYAKPDMDLIDLFIGSEGTLGIIVEATLRVIPRPRRAVALIRCEDDQQTVAVTGELRGESRADHREKRDAGWVSAIEYMDARALRAVSDEAFTRAGVQRPTGRSVLLMAQIEVDADEGATFERLQKVLDSCGVTDEATVAAPDDERGVQRLFELREAVPSSVNALVAAAKARTHPDIEKTAGDMVVPFERLAESLALYRDAFDSRGLEYAIWGHVSDGNLHPNVIPRTLDEMLRGREAIFDIARGVIAMGGAPLAEHGVGRSTLKQRLLSELYGDEGIDQMRAVKRALDPDWKLAPGVLFSS